jgi:hypothetical protein
VMAAFQQRIRGPEALRRRLSTVMPLFDVRSVTAPRRLDIWGEPASTHGGWREEN